MSKVNVAVDTKKREAKAALAASKTEAAQPNSIPALKAAVAKLIAAVEDLQRRL